MSIIDDLLSKKPETRTVPVPLDPHLAERYADAKTAYEQAKRTSDAAPKDEDRAREPSRKPERPSKR